MGLSIVKLSSKQIKQKFKKWKRIRANKLRLKLKTAVISIKGRKATNIPFDDE